MKDKGLGFRPVPGTMVIDYTDEHSEQNDPKETPAKESWADDKVKIFDGVKSIEAPVVPITSGLQTKSGIFQSKKEVEDERKTLPYTCVAVADDVNFIKVGEKFLMRGNAPMELFEWNGRKYANVSPRSVVVIIDKD